MSLSTEDLLRQAANPNGAVGRLMVGVWARHFAPMVHWGLEAAPASPSLVLDVGCGGGAGVKAALAHWPGARVTGVDISPVAVRATLKLNRAAVKAGRARALVGDAAALPLPDETADLALAVQTHIFWPDVAAGLRELNRVLRPGGVLLLLCEQDKLAYHTPQASTRQAVAALLEAAGFASVEYEAQGNWRRWTALV